MCEQDLVSAMPAGRDWRAGVTRRDFARIGAAAGAGVLATASGGAALAQSTLREKMVIFPAPGGQMDGMLIHPATGKHPAVILWPDIAGLRDAKLTMARDLARAGYTVLVANPYYRSVEGVQFEDFDEWREAGGFDRVRPWMAENTPAAIAETAAVIVEWLDDQDEVDTSRGIGAQGYCMTGSWTIRAAAAVPDRVKAAASFHGGGLVGEGADAPVNLLGTLPADTHVLIAIAKNDDAQAPTDKDVLRAAGDAAAAQVTVEVYQGDHGWTVLDSPVYDYDEGDRAWAALLAMYSEAL
ncbi:dienelactone hydrolase family protein [Altererythrobacter sp. KTW20L]|uniref:dienelactone hydrolase family protein n=1 Tax=Altererythrobacter sp. KTW20L TaxID=2942210 RepID=UPI0020BFE7D5|nr:dienelactone hydrolase family protein [Altererythrobacter sp. KTW20L]MCL6252232.1 dienelactone hydrolase family protein [Altererythrobacter sp. KTW20L]